ncbi:Cystathionine beta-lyase PatB [Hydrogenovibrio crunogenus]|uniref:cysteine-S-conjugate beta-lyase n=1 Tax=Hydrogenovibrio crunogenus TaxID=39765 RepID=A0A4P7P0B9_9GAMM|nr:pyridoxal phosphate-dependent aminotransferase [Hydrogenovibrio crunogenus]QBZ83580.1 Cystathionine beta-lyase PatB [Hydrogenovibrio crunogenus]
MKVEFINSISRLGTDAEKYELRQKLFGTDDVLPMWVADQDLPTPSFILEVLKKRLEHPILGYNHMPDSLYQSIVDWQAQYYYEVDSSDIVFTHNVANGFFMAVSAFTNPGDAILVQPPVYPPFLTASAIESRQCVEAPLILQNDRYEIDFDVFEQKIIDHQVKLFLFCNPQNPSGRVWLKSELEKLAAICLKHDVVVVSDEIHADMTYPEHQHIPMASITEESQNNTVTLSSPGKTFNLGGLQIGYAIIANPELKAAYLKICQANAIQDLNLFGYLATQAAYSDEGRQYRDQLLQYFLENIERVKTFFHRFLPQVKVMIPEASYLVWLDFSAIFESQEALKDWLVYNAKLGLNDGESFGKAGKGFMRMNLAVPEETLTQALAQLKQAITSNTLPK